MDKEKFKKALQDMKESVFGKEMKFKDAKLKDGTIISYEAEMPAIGVPVMAVTEQGKLPLPDGDYEMEDGTLFKCVAGVISEITPVEAAAEGGEQPPTAPAAGEMSDPSKTTAAAKAIVESIIKETRFAEIVKEIEAEKEELKTAKENFTSQKDTSEKEIKELKERLETLTTQFAKAVELIEQIGGEASDIPAEGKPRPTTKRKSLKDLQAEFRGAIKSTN